MSDTDIFTANLSKAILLADSHINSLENAIDSTALEALPVAYDRDETAELITEMRSVFEFGAEAHAVLAGMHARLRHAEEFGIGDRTALEEENDRLKKVLHQANIKLDSICSEHDLDPVEIGPAPDTLEAYAAEITLEAYAAEIPTRGPDTAAERRRMDDHVAITSAANLVGRKQIAELVMAGWQHKHWGNDLMQVGVISDHIDRLQARDCQETTVETYNEALGQLKNLVKSVPAELPTDVLKPSRKGPSVDM